MLGTLILLHVHILGSDSPLPMPGTLTLSLTHSTPPSAVSWYFLEGLPVCSGRLAYVPFVQPTHPTLPPTHHRQGEQLPATVAPTWQVHTPVSVPTLLAAPMMTSGRSSKLQQTHTQSFHTPTTCLVVGVSPIMPSMCIWTNS